MPNGGLKYDKDKIRYDLLAPEFEEGVAKVLTMGSAKYADDSWQDLPNATNRYYAATRRHIAAWRKGEMLDQESGLHHLFHAACNLYFLLHGDDYGSETDS